MGVLFKESWATSAIPSLKECGETLGVCCSKGAFKCGSL
jgi:hypothetical protein